MASASTSTATKTDTDVKDIPQALTIVSEQQIEDQQLRSVADLLLSSPARPTSRRGQPRPDRAARQQQHRRLLRRRRARRRPIFPRFLQRRPGRGAEGPERDDLRPRRRRRDRQPRAQAAELDAYRAAHRIGRRLGRRALDRRPRPAAEQHRRRSAQRAWSRTADSFRDHVDFKRYGINPTAAIAQRADTRIDLSYEHFHDRRTADRGVPGRRRRADPRLHPHLLRRSGRQLRQGRHRSRHARGRA